VASLVSWIPALFFRKCKGNGSESLLCYAVRYSVSATGNVCNGVMNPFAINATSGELKLAKLVAFSYSIPPPACFVDIILTDSNRLNNVPLGNGTSVTRVQLHVIETNWNPVFTSNRTLELYENIPLASVLYQANFSDRNLRDRVYYELVPGLGWAYLFAMDSSTGTLSLANPVNYEAIGASGFIIVRITDDNSAGVPSGPGLSTDTRVNVTVRANPLIDAHAPWYYNCDRGTIALTGMLCTGAGCQ
jgi:hypothetical protein